MRRQRHLPSADPDDRDGIAPGTAGVRALYNNLARRGLLAAAAR